MAHYNEARRMVNNLVVDRLGVKLIDWQVSSNGGGSDSGIPHDLLTELGTHVGELGILRVGKPPI